MSDQNTSVDTGATDANNSADAGTGTQEERDYQALYEQEKQRADNLQPEFTRATQELSQHRQLIEALSDEDPATRQWAAGQLGLTYVEDEQEDNQTDGLDPQELTQRELAQLREELSGLKESISTRDKTTQENEFRDQVVAGLKSEEYPEGLRGLVADLVLNQARDTGQTDLEAAKQAVEGMAEAWAQHPAVQTLVKKGWQRTKPTTAATQPGGVQATHTQPLDTREQRAEYIAQLAAQANADD